MQPDGFVEIIEEGTDADYHFKFSALLMLIDARYHIPRTSAVVHRAAQGKWPILQRSPKYQ